MKQMISKLIIKWILTSGIGKFNFLLGAFGAAVFGAVVLPEGAAAGAGASETKKKMSLFITTVPADKKVEAIKVVKTVLNLSLMDAKNMIEGVINSGKAKIKEGEQDELKVISENW